MFEFLMIIAGLGLFAYVNQQSGKLKTLTKDIRALKKQIEDLSSKSLLPVQTSDQSVAAAVEVEPVQNAGIIVPEAVVESHVADAMQDASDQAADSPGEAARSAAEPVAEAEAKPLETEAVVPVMSETVDSAEEPASVSESLASSDATKIATKVESPPKPKESFESKLGARWTVWVGGLALAVGGLFMVKYSIENVLVSPAVRLSLAALFGMALFAAGEAVRRRMGAFASATFQNAMIPGVLTAAGSVTLMGSIFAAHMFYAYLSAGTAFTLLALVSLLTVALSLMHGQALAGLGLLAAFVTPLAVRSTEPNPWALFLFLIVAWLSTNLASRIRHWIIVPVLANVGLSFWAILYVLDTNSGTWPVTFAMIAMILGTAFVWPGSKADADTPSVRTLRIRAALQKKAAQAGVANDADLDGIASVTRVADLQTPAEDLLFGSFSPNFISMSIGAALLGLVVLVTGTTGVGLPENPLPTFIALVALLGGLGVYRLQAGFSALTAVGLAVIGAIVLCTPLMATTTLPSAIIVAVVNPGSVLSTCAALAVILLGLGLAKTFVLPNVNVRLEQILSTVFIGGQIAVLVLAYFAVGNFSRDWAFGLMTIVAALVCLAIAEALHRRSETAEASASNPLIATYVFGSALNIIFAIHALANGIATTLLVAALGFAYVLARRLRPWTILPWIMGLADVVVMARIGWNPAIVSADSLSTTPFFNALLPGYGIPTLLTALAAYNVRKGASESVRNFLQALASLGVLLTIAILVRHAMNGGVLDSTIPTLAEQSIYTLLAIGASAVLMTLDMKAPSPVFRWGSMGVGVLSILSIAFAHLLRLNPVATGENTGSWPFFDLLLIGYLLPGLAALGLSYYAEGKRPYWYRNLIEATGNILLLVWVPLELRHIFSGPILSSDSRIAATEVFLWPIGWLGLSLLQLVISRYLAGRDSEHNQFSWYAPTFAMSLQRASLGFAGIGILALVFANLTYLNPYFSGESTGSSAVFNLILLGYLLPAVLVWLRALLGRRSGESLYALMGLSISGLVLMFSYITLTVRRAWQGEFIPSWNGFLQGETYTYSVVWLIFGVLLLVLGSRLNAISLRLASAAIVFLTVGKVFLFDMSNLEGILRALSFIGLGLVLIAIGMFYQRVLGNLALPKTGGAGTSDSDRDQST